LTNVFRESVEANTATQAPTHAPEEFLRLAEDALRGASAEELQLDASRLVARYPALRERIAGVVALARVRTETEAALRLNEARLAEAQRVGTMGSYDWEIVTDTNVWSDELYRIYGTEPQSFNASYEKFMEFIHPDVREKIKAVHAEAFRTCERYQTEERIVRPDGDIRVLATTGEVATDADGRPARIYGICRDITDQRRAEDAARRQAERFEALVESAPDTVVVVDQNGVIVQVNRQLELTFGYSPSDLLGERIETFLPAAVTDLTANFDAGFQWTVRHKNGSGIPVDISRGVLTTDEGQMVAAFVRDVTERKRAEEFALRLHDAEMRRRHALEINDNVVQGLSAAAYAFEAGFDDDALAALRSTVAAARLMMNDLLGHSAATMLHAGDLVRDRPAAPALPIDALIRTEEALTGGSRRVLLVDDSSDIRLLLRRMLTRVSNFDVVGEASDGREAIALATNLQPDVVVLDLAMPIMDGLEALPQLRQRLPHAKIVVLSGFDEARTEQAALDAGADAYIEKGGELASFVATLELLVPLAS
jgi:PAS domain S-box-containing protein